VDECKPLPTARFVELAVGDAAAEEDGTGGMSLADELGMRDEGGDDAEDVEVGT